ncbi:MAG: hypothetical protein ACYDG2_03435 [Ruminiclostridium sp.]
MVRRKKLSLIFMCIIVSMFVFSISSYANTTVNVHKESSNVFIMWINTDLIDVALNFSGLNANCYVNIIGKNQTTKITASVNLQRKNLNGTYTNVKTWSNLSEVGTELIFNDYYYVTSGYTYRLIVNTNVYKGSSYESIAAYDENYCDNN